MVQMGDITKQDLATILPIAKVDSFTRDLTLASGTQVITGIGFKPSSVQFLSIQDVVEAVSFGFSDTVRDKCQFQEFDGSWVNGGSNCIILLIAATDGYEATVDSFDDDGFTVNWVKINSPTGTGKIKFQAFK